MYMYTGELLQYRLINCSTQEMSQKLRQRKHMATGGGGGGGGATAPVL